MSDTPQTQIGDETVFVPIRGFASGAVHLALDRDWDQLMAFNVECEGSLTPIGAACGAMVGRGRGIVRMRDGARVTCVHCRRWAT